MYIHLCQFLCWKYHDCELRHLNASTEFFGIATLAMLHHRNGGHDFPAVLNNWNLVIFFVQYTICMAHLAHG